ncbi:GNAT family N-acetyltransferase [Bacillus sp. EB01]|uniref:GNAT family N-acetyltransferase n=1 Tax=Bacillus sp. EB01 TaxID=1347086 RepID=UPI0022AF0469|nr:GNAT family N-acetyltransferase [Bacillus sp. EB01]
MPTIDKESYIVETNRLRLRKMTREDTDHLMSIFSDPIAMQFYPSTKTTEDAEKWISWNLDLYQKYSTGLWICERKEDGAFVGQCGIVPQIVDGVNEMEIGYLFVRKNWGKGYATEAALAVKDYGFDKLGLNRIISMIFYKNEPSIRVAERIGMVLEKRTIVKGRETLIYFTTRRN